MNRLACFLPVAVFACVSVAFADGFRCPACKLAFDEMGTCPVDGKTLEAVKLKSPTPRKPKPEPAEKPTCALCQTDYPVGTTTCEKDGAALGVGGPDLSHVAAGQDYVFEVEAAGHRSKMIYRVVEVKDGKVHYEVLTVMEVNGEEQTFEGAAAVWPAEEVAQGQPPQQPVNYAFKSLPNESLTVDGMTFDCQVIQVTLPDGGTSKTWMPMRPAGVVTFPVVFKTESHTNGLDTVMNLVKITGGLNPAAATEALNSLALAQTLFRDEDRDRNNTTDFAASLKALGKAELIDAKLAGGRVAGYRIELVRSAKTPKDAWLATASPASGKGPHFAVNHKGVVYSGEAAFKHNVQCEIRGGAPVRQD